MFAILVRMVDAIAGVPGAAVLINRQEIVGRRHDDLAHERFHVLTCDTMPPDHTEPAAGLLDPAIDDLPDLFQAHGIASRAEV